MAPRPRVGRAPLLPRWRGDDSGLPTTNFGHASAARIGPTTQRPRPLAREPACRTTRAQDQMSSRRRCARSPPGRKREASSRDDASPKRCAPAAPAAGARIGGFPHHQLLPPSSGPARRALQGGGMSMSCRGPKGLPPGQRLLPDHRLKPPTDSNPPLVTRTPGGREPLPGRERSRNSQATNSQFVPLRGRARRHASLTRRRAARGVHVPYQNECTARAHPVPARRRARADPRCSPGPEPAPS